MANQDEYKFPDEETAGKADESVGTEIEIKIEDDTPEADRNKKPLPKEVVEELEKDDLEDYSEKVQNRIKQMKKVYHDERREKERAAREKEEALRFAQAQLEENRRLKQRLGVGEKVFVNEMTKAAARDLNVAKDRLKSAYEAGDADQITAAQESMTDAKLKLQQLARYQPALQQQDSGVQVNQQVPTPPAYSPPVIDQKAEEWKQRNTWFGVDEEMTALALGLHEKLVRSGIDPRSDDYYRRVDETMRKRFPETFEDSEEQPQSRQSDKAARKPANVVAPVTRGTAPRQVRLTPTQVAIAKKLGLSNEQYAREVMKLETNNG